MLTVIGECVLRSSLHPPSLVSHAPLFIRAPHSLPLAFNAALGSPLIKVKASQCLDNAEKGREGVEKKNQRGFGMNR